MLNSPKRFLGQLWGLPRNFFLADEATSPVSHNRSIGSVFSAEYILFATSHAMNT